MPYYFTKNEIVEKDFLVVSYRHENKDSVVQIIDSLLEYGIRIWCDKDLAAGDCWDKEVQALVQHPKCKGAICFNSVESFLGEGTRIERKMILDELKRREDCEQEYCVMPVNFGTEKISRLLKMTFEQLNKDDADSFVFDEDNIRVIIELFPKQKICICDRDGDLKVYADTLIESVKRQCPTTMDEPLSNFHAANKSFELGHYRKSQPTTVSVYHSDGKAFFYYEGENYVVEDDNVYRMRSVEWLPIAKDDETVTLISKYILSRQHAGAQLEEWLNTKFKEIAFNKEEQALIVGNIRLLDYNEAIELDGKEVMKAGFDRESKTESWWLSREGNVALQKTVNEDGKIYKRGFHFARMQAGIRPIIKVDYEYYKSQIKN